MKYEIYVKSDVAARCENPLCESNSADKAETRIYLATRECFADIITGKDNCICTCCGKPMSIELSTNKFPFIPE